MIKARKNVFETNSSSTHAICVPSNCSRSISNVHFGIGEFGWAENIADAADYFWTAICCGVDSLEEYENKRSIIHSILESNDISCEFEEPDFHNYSDGSIYLDNGYIDHAEEAVSFANELLENEDKFIAFLSDGYVITSNDNLSSDEKEWFNKQYDEAVKSGHEIVWKGN